MVFPGWTVARAIPYKYLTELLMGQYTLTGGVIRHAAGTGRGGQIVAHLLPAASQGVPGLNFLPGLIANFQLHHLTGTVQHVAGAVNLLGTQVSSLSALNAVNTYQLFKLSGQVADVAHVTHSILHLAAGTALLSGLNLAVSIFGFASIHQKLQAIDTHLREIHRDIRAIRVFLELGERAELRAALHDLLRLDAIEDGAMKQALLNDRRQILLKLKEKYQELFLLATTLETAVAYEEYFVITGLAATRCTAELEWYPLAQQEMTELSTVWRDRSRQFASTHLLGRHPERFLARDFAEELPISTVVSWLDFVHDDTRGYEWIDELRRDASSWYRQREKSSRSTPKAEQRLRNRHTTQHSPSQRPSAQRHTPGKRRGFRHERDVTIPLLQKLVTRNAVLEGYVSQYELLAQHEMTPTQFKQNVKELSEEDAVEGYYILYPENEA